MMTRLYNSNTVLEVIALTAILSACLPKSELTKRYANYYQSGVGSSNLLSTSGFSTGINKSTTKTTLASLSDHGQSALILALSSKAKDNNELLELLGREIKGKRN